MDHSSFGIRQSDSPTTAAAGARPRPLQHAVPRNERGFALLLTVALLAFLVLVLVALATLTRVETTVATNNQHLAQARQNALMALNIALGQLQKFAGPDQRVTGTADLATGDDSAATGGSRITNGSSPSITVGNKKYWDSTSTPNGLSVVQAGTRYWTGVWGNADPATPMAGNGNIYEKTPRPVLLNWLVSGNESATFTASSASGSFGQITTAGSSIRYTPSGTALASGSATVSPALSVTTTATTPLKLNNQDVALLVGPNTAGTADHPTTGEPAIDRYVVAPLVDVETEANAIPGLGSATTSTGIGRYAYWVGDEGVKARINLTDPYSDKDNAITQDEARYRLMTAPRTGLEIVNDFSNSSYAEHTQAPTLSNNTASNILAIHQAPFLDNGNITSTKIAPRFHDFTTTSVGIAADSYNGGLRKDLTYYFSQPSFPTWTGTNGAPAGSGTSIIPSSFSPHYNNTTYVPQWNVLYDFCNYYFRNQSSGTAPAQGATLTTMGITPQLLQVRVIVGVNATSGQKIKTLFTPLLVFGNPYSVPLSISGWKVKFWLAGAFGNEKWPNQVDRMVAFAVGTTGASNARERFMKLLTYDGDANNGFGSLTGAVEFKLLSTTSSPDITFQPGETKIFSLKASADVATSPISLTEGNADEFAGTYHYVWRTSTWDSPANGGGTHYYKFNESDDGSPMIVEIINSANPSQTIQKIAILDLNVQTNTFGIYTEPNGATNTDRIIAEFDADLTDPGTSDASLRAYADFNQRAGTIRLTNATTMGGTFYRSSPNLSLLTDANALTPSVPPLTFTNNLDPVEWGRHGGNAVSGTYPTPTLFDLPQGTTPILSMGQLQHANVTADDQALNVGHQPGNAVGNSYASIFVRRELSIQPRTDTYISRWRSPTASYQATRNYYDLSYRLNAALWDGYFFSSIPQSGTSFTPVNPRLALSLPTSSAQARNGHQAAAHTLIDGAFNINSTSIDAWTTMLAGMRSLPALPVTGATSNDKTTIFPRSLRQPSDALTQSGATTAINPSGDEADSYSGFRRLTDSQVASLATAIVKQVRLRGPFVSLSHFVNRVLVAAASDTSGLGFTGALQAAIDSTSINDFGNVTTADDALIIPASHTYYAETTSSDFSLNAQRPPQRSTGIPGWLTQADVLQAIAPILSARSDTFTIRTYGETLDPINSTAGNPVVLGRAWCEAVVQRIPDYVDTEIPAETAPSAAISTNQTFGRRFEVISFRWLTPNDI